MTCGKKPSTTPERRGIPRRNVIAAAVLAVFALAGGAAVTAPAEAANVSKCVAKAKKKHGPARAKAIAKCVKPPTPKPAPPPPPGSSRDRPIPFGTPATGQNWQVTVLGITPDATAAVLAENQFNDPPALGTQFYIATVRVTYIGPGSQSILAALDFGAVGGSAVAYTTFGNSCGVIPSDLPQSTELFTGGTVEGNVCWQVRNQDAADLVAYVEAGRDRVYLALR